MTCIVGLKDKNGVYIGGDSAGSTSSVITVRRDEKVFANGPFIIGIAGSFRMGQLLRFNLKVPRQLPRTSDYEFMVTIFIEAVRKCLLSGGFLKKENNIEEHEGGFIVGYKDNIYLIDGDLQVEIPSDNYTAMGSGQEYALGSLNTPHVLNSPVKKIRYALESAAKFSPSVRGPFIIVKKIKNGKAEISEYK